jgi:hypothetical protein
MNQATGTADWISAQDAVAAVRAAMPNHHPGKELVNAAMKAGFGSRARIAVFFTADGSGALAKREHAYDIPPEWWWPSADTDQPRGLQSVNLTKAEGWALIDADGGQQRVELVGISFRRADVDEHFGIASVVTVVQKAPAKRGAKPKYDWHSFHSEALDRLEENGGFLGIDWGQSDLEREMLDWCAHQWGVTPGESTARGYIVKADQEYRARKAGQ